MYFSRSVYIACNHHSSGKRSQIICVCLNYYYQNAPDYAKQKVPYPVIGVILYTVLWKINRMLSNKMNRFLFSSVAGYISWIFHKTYFAFCHFWLGIDIPGSVYQHTISWKWLLADEIECKYVPRFKYIEI